ncbi:MAG: 2-C-methyl-D-erythritol 4-phosphate cytidylyltransferase, partial [Candidatus Scatosoma sp.]
MMGGTKISAVICAGGKGTRAGFAENKLLKNTLGIPVLERTLAAFSLPEIDEIVVAAAKDDFAKIQPICKKYGAKITEGGKTRFLSVYNALRAASGDMVLIHDGARPFVSTDVIYGCIASVRDFQSGICAVPATDTLACADTGGNVLSYPVRAATYRLQTPQGFYLNEILLAYERAVADGKTFLAICGGYQML